MTITITAAIIAAIAPQPRLGATSVAEALDAALPEYEIDTPARVAACLAQLAHESAGFRTTVEYADGKAYEGRLDLGNTQAGDGPRYRGRGLIQITGRSNYELVQELTGMPTLDDPDLLCEPGPALLSALAWWGENVPDAENLSVAQVTRRVNGGTNGLAARQQLFDRALVVLEDAS